MPVSSPDRTQFVYLLTDISLDIILENICRSNSNHLELFFLHRPLTIEDVLLFIDLDRAILASPAPILPGPGDLHDHSPERLLTFTWDRSADIWAFGVLFICLLSGEHPFDATGIIDNHLVLLTEQVRWFGCRNQFGGAWPEDLDTTMQSHGNDIAKGGSHGLLTMANDDAGAFGRMVRWNNGNKIRKSDKKFISKIMKLDPSKRPTARQLLRDRWFGVAGLWRRGERLRALLRRS